MPADETLGQILFERKLATVGLQDRDRATGLADWVGYSLRSQLLWEESKD